MSFLMYVLHIVSLGDSLHDFTNTSVNLSVDPLLQDCRIFLTLFGGRISCFKLNALVLMYFSRLELEFNRVIFIFGFLL